MQVSEKILASKLQSAESSSVKLEAPKPPRQPKVGIYSSVTVWTDGLVHWVFFKWLYFLLPTPPHTHTHTHSLPRPPCSGMYIGPCDSTCCVMGMGQNPKNSMACQVVQCSGYFTPGSLALCPAGCKSQCGESSEQNCRGQRQHQGDPETRVGQGETGTAACVRAEQQTGTHSDATQLQGAHLWKGMPMQPSVKKYAER